MRSDKEILFNRAVHRILLEKIDTMSSVNKRLYSIAQLSRDADVPYNALFNYFKSEESSLSFYSLVKVLKVLDIPSISFNGVTIRV